LSRHCINTIGDGEFEKEAVYLVPLGGGFEKQLDFEELRFFCECYLRMQTLIHPPVHLVKEAERSSSGGSCYRVELETDTTDGATKTNRREEIAKLVGRKSRGYGTQLKTEDVHNLLSSIKARLPNARFVVGVTMKDLYPRDDWNFVFGNYYNAIDIDSDSLTLTSPKVRHRQREVLGSIAL